LVSFFPRCRLRTRRSTSMAFCVSSDAVGIADAEQRSLSTSSTEAAVASGGDTRGPHSTPRVYGAPPPSTRAPRSLAVDVRSTRVRRKRWRTPRTA
jgi:hypothetical protein